MAQIQAPSIIAARGQRHRICFVAPHGYPVLAQDRGVPVVGGAEVQQRYLAVELARRGHQVSMVSMDFGQAEGTVFDGVTVHKTFRPDAGLPVLRFLTPRLTGLWQALKRADADIYYQRSAGLATGVVAAFAQRHRRRAVFAGACDLDFDPELPKLALARERVVCRYGLRHADAIVVQTARQVELCRDNLGRESVRVASCYGHQGAAAQQRGPIIWVGMVKPVKRPALFLELARRLPEYTFRMIGGGHLAPALYDELRKAAEDIPNLSMTGFMALDEAEAAFDGASVLVNTTEFEGFPNTFMQAWSRGMPTVSFFDAGARLDGREVGCTVSDLDAMAAKLRELKSSPARWAEEGARAAGYHAGRHSVAAAVEAYEQLFDRLASERPQSQLQPQLAGSAALDTLRG